MNKFYMAAATVVFALILSWQSNDNTTLPPAHASVINNITPPETLPSPTADCDPRGCGLIDFEAHPELIGGGLVLEPSK